MSPPWGTFNAQVWDSNLQLLDLNSSVFIHLTTPPPGEARERERERDRRQVLLIRLPCWAGCVWTWMPCFLPWHNLQCLAGRWEPVINSLYASTCRPAHVICSHWDSWRSETARFGPCSVNVDCFVQYLLAAWRHQPLVDNWFTFPFCLSFIYSTCSGCLYILK